MLPLVLLFICPHNRRRRRRTFFECCELMLRTSAQGNNTKSVTFSNARDTYARTHRHRFAAHIVFRSRAARRHLCISIRFVAISIVLTAIAIVTQ